MDDSLKFISDSDFYTKNHQLEEVHIPVLVGDDQAFSVAQESFEFLDILARHMNEYSLEIYGQQYEVRYSTIDEFLTELKKNDLEYEVYKGDFFP